MHVQSLRHLGYRLLEAIELNPESSKGLANKCGAPTVNSKLAFRIEMRRILILSALTLMLVSITCAHQPRIVFGNQTSPENPVIIEDPEISKAYYGILNGTSDFYDIEAYYPFRLYLNILVPDLNDSRTDFIVEVSSRNTSLLILNGSNYYWTKFYEEFAGDNYLKGPEIYENLSEGLYHIRVYTQDNKGKYSLAVGDIESFPPSEVMNVLFTLPRIQREFFEKPSYSAYLNRFVLFLLVPTIILFLVIGILIWQAHSRKSRRN